MWAQIGTARQSYVQKLGREQGAGEASGVRLQTTGTVGQQRVGFANIEGVAWGVSFPELPGLSALWALRGELSGNIFPGIKHRGVGAVAGYWGEVVKERGPAWWELLT